VSVSVSGGRARVEGLARPAPGPRGRGRGRALGSLIDTRAWWPAPLGAHRGRRRSRGGARRRRSRPCPGRRPQAGGPARPRASRRTRGRSMRTAAACSPTQPGQRSASPPEQVPLLHPQRRRRRDHRHVDELVDERAVDQLKLQRWLHRGEGEPLLAHRPGPFPKPHISGHVNRASDVSVAASRDTGLAALLRVQRQRFQHRTPPNSAARSPPNIGEDHGVGGGSGP
jgi:hypothetical protein